MVLVPFFFEEPEHRGNASFKSSETGETPTPGESGNTVLVAIHTATLQIDLFDRAGRDTLTQDYDEDKSKFHACNTLSRLIDF